MAHIQDSKYGKVTYAKEEGALRMRQVLKIEEEENGPDYLFDRGPVYITEEEVLKYCENRKPTLTFLTSSFSKRDLERINKSPYVEFKGTWYADITRGEIAVTLTLLCPDEIIEEMLEFLGFKEAV